MARASGHHPLLRERARMPCYKRFLNSAQYTYIAFRAPAFFLLGLAFSTEIPDGHKLLFIPSFFISILRCTYYCLMTLAHSHTSCSVISDLFPFLFFRISGGGWREVWEGKGK